MAAAGEIGWGRLAAYGLPALPLAAVTLSAHVYLPAFYAAQLGLPLAAVGFALLAARLWDVASDPLVGWLADKGVGPFGRRLFWLVAGTPLTAAAVWQLYLPPPGAGLGHLALWSVLLSTGWTLMIVPLSAWGAELSRDYHGRTRIAGVREAFVLAGTMAAALAPLAASGRADAESLALVGIAAAVGLPLAVCVLALCVPEPEARAWAPLAPGRSLAILWRSRPLRRLALAHLLNGVAGGLPATLFVLFLDRVIGRPDLTGPLLALYFGCGVLGLPLWSRLSRRIGKHRAWAMAMAWSALCFPAVLLLGPGDWLAFAAICVVTGLALGADLALPSAMVADVADADLAESGRERTAMLYAVTGTVTKLSLALAVGLAFPLLSVAGFSAGTGGGGEGLWALAALYGFLPVPFKLAAAAVVWRFPIDVDEQARLVSANPLDKGRIHVPSGPPQARPAGAHAPARRV